MEKKPNPKVDLANLFKRRKLSSNIAHAFLPQLPAQSDADLRSTKNPVASNTQVAQADKAYQQGNEHIGRGDLDSAIPCFQRAIALNPAAAQAHNNLGCVFHLKGQLEEAEVAFRKALAVAPSYADAHTNLGTTLADGGQVAASEYYLRRAIELDPNGANNFINLGRVLNWLGEQERAQGCFERALKINPDHPKALVGLGGALSQKGRDAEAEALFERALAISPKMPAALAAIAGLRKMTAADGDWLRTVESIVDGGLAPLDEANLRFAMGKFCDDVKDFDRAYVNYRRANELKAAVGKAYVPGEQAAFVARLMDAFSAERMRQSGCGRYGELFITAIMQSSQL